MRSPAAEDLLAKRLVTTTAMIGLLTRNTRNPDIAVDLGSALTRVSTERSPSYLERPSRVGAQSAVRGGAVLNPSLASEVLDPMFRRVQRSGRRPSRVLAAAPSDASDVERANLVEAIRGASGGAVYIVPKPLAAAIGAGADVGSDELCMVMDIGEGVADCALLAEGCLLTSATVRGGCAAFRAEVRLSIARETGLDVPDDECNRLLQHVGLPDGTNSGMILAVAHEEGHHFPRKQALPRELIAQAIQRGVEHTLAPLVTFARNLDPFTLAALDERPVYLTGGGALIPGMVKRVEELFGLQVRAATAPHHAVIRGASAMLEIADLAGVWTE
jgi:rod shape-determining protein MreB and related proteins